jgi:glycosyltransferase involved in cell wall biosynthesis
MEHVPISAVPRVVGQKRKILYLIDEIEGIAEGGTERQILQLIHLARRLGYEPQLAVLRGTDWLSEERAGCPIYQAGVGSFRLPSSWRACRELVRWMHREQFAMVQTFFIECNLIGPWLGRMARIPVVVGSRRNLNSWMGWATRQVQAVANLSTDYIVANSQVAAESVGKTERIPAKKIRVAYNGINLKKFASLTLLRRDARENLGIADNEILAGNISCMRPVKGVRQFVDAARLVLDKDPNFRFLVVGDGQEWNSVVERIRELGIGDRIHLAGTQTNILPYLAAMDIGVLSSLAEGFSNSLLEYMAAGLPTVATEAGGNREALEDAGMLVPPDDPAALAQAILGLRAPEQRARLGQAARQRVQRFSLAQAEQCMEDLYSEMLGA